MLIRVWHIWTRPEDADAYEDMLKPELLPGISKVEGYLAATCYSETFKTKFEFITVMFGTPSTRFARLLDRTMRRPLSL